MNASSPPAFPVKDEDATGPVQQLSLTKRELIAAMTLQGLVAAGRRAGAGTAAEAVQLADSLIAELAQA